MAQVTECRFENSKLAWTTISKMRGVMGRIYKVGILHERVSNNPVEHVQTRCKSSYRAIVITPAQTLVILNSLPALLHRTLILTCAATALRSSEILALRWSDIRWSEDRIRVSKRWADGKDGQTKTDASDGYVPLHPILAQHLHEWHDLTPYGKDTDFVFHSFLPQRRTAAFPSPLPHSSLTIFGRQRKQPECRSKTVSGSGFTICVTA